MLLKIETEDTWYGKLLSFKGKLLSFRRKVLSFKGNLLSFRGKLLSFRGNLHPTEKKLKPTEQKLRSTEKKLKPIEFLFETNWNFFWNQLKVVRPKIMVGRVWQNTFSINNLKMCVNLFSLFCNSTLILSLVSAYLEFRKDSVL